MCKDNQICQLIWSSEYKFSKISILELCGEKRENYHIIMT